MDRRPAPSPSPEQAKRRNRCSSASQTFLNALSEKQKAASQNKQPEGCRLRNDNAFTEPVIRPSAGWHSIVPRFSTRVTRREFITDVQKTCRQQHRLEEVELARRYRDVLRKIKRAEFNRSLYKNDRVSAAENWPVVCARSQIHHKSHLIVAREPRDKLTTLHETHRRQRRREGLSDLVFANLSEVF